jgi:hypothetical protein
LVTAVSGVTPARVVVVDSSSTQEALAVGSHLILTHGLVEIQARLEQRLGSARTERGFVGFDRHRHHDVTLKNLLDKN